jgi:hypothetical protein
MAGGLQKKKRDGGKASSGPALKKPDSRAKKVAKKKSPKVKPISGY